MKLELLPGEEIVLHDDFAKKASIFSFLWPGPVGELFLTNKRLVWLSAALNFGRKIDVPRSDITRVKKFLYITRLLIPLPIGLMVQLKNGKKAKFAISERKNWLKALSD